MKTNWFKRFGWFYAPISWQGMFLVIVALAFCAQVFVAIDRHSHSVTDTLYHIFPYFVCCFLMLDWVAARTSLDRDSHEGK
jgi:peptidoglycan/LPS O-acetylase OafA/YrhL